MLPSNDKDLCEHVWAYSNQSRGVPDQVRIKYVEVVDSYSLRINKKDESIEKRRVGLVYILIEEVR